MHQRATTKLKNYTTKLILPKVREAYAKFVAAQQVRLSNDFDGLPFIVLLGIICGLISASVIIIFRIVLEGYAVQWIGLNSLQSFEKLPTISRILLCIGGALLVGLLLNLIKAEKRQVGIVHVLERLEYYQGYLPLKNGIVQFIGALISLVSGQSVGGEGPSVHLGAMSSSVLGRLLKAPNNSIRILIGCGVASAIAATFNTPLAGVIFAMEVVLMEYTILGFTPVILAAVSATTLTHSIFGNTPIFYSEFISTNILHELPVVAMMGIIIGALSALFITSTLFFTSLFKHQAIWFRVFIAGVITALLAIELPQIMGTGYDTINLMLASELGVMLALMLVLAKIISTSSAIGLGIPAGLIGPTLFIGAAAGNIIASFANLLFNDSFNTSFYTILGMAAMMAATLQAPLAALIYLLELTTNQAIILPGMVAVISALLITRVVFKKHSIYRLLLLNKGRDYRNSPLSQALRRIGVASVMKRNIIQQNNLISLANAKQLLSNEPSYLFIIDHKEEKAALLPATDLARYLGDLPNDSTQEMQIDLFKIPAKRRTASAITMVATLQDAYEKMQSEECDVLYVIGAHGVSKQRIFGIINKEHIENAYRV